MYNILTSFNRFYWDEIGHHTIKKLDENWYPGGTIFLYHEMDDKFVNSVKGNFSSRVKWISLHEEVPEIKEFAEKFKDHPRANGFGEGQWRWHAIKWIHKTFPLLKHVKQQKDGWLFWLDVDAECYKKVDDAFIKNICNESKIMCYIGRKRKYSECGFLGFNLNNPETKKFVDFWWNVYPSGDFTGIKETHDSWIFDEMKKRFNKNELFDDLNSHSDSDKNPFRSSRIGNYFVHAKGQNKKAAFEVIKRNR